MLGWLRSCKGTCTFHTPNISKRERERGGEESVSCIYPPTFLGIPSNPAVLRGGVSNVLAMPRRWRSFSALSNTRDPSSFWTWVALEWGQNLVYEVKTMIFGVSGHTIQLQIHTHARIQTCTYTCTHTDMHLHMHTYRHALTHALIQTCTYTCTHTDMTHVCIHTYRHAHTYMHIHTYTCT